MFLALAIAAICGPARGHQAPSGWEYPLACCAQRDCARVPPPQVTPAGLVFRLGPGDHPMVRAPITITLPADDPRLQGSGDGEWHLCLRSVEPRVICGFRPPMGF